MQTIDPDAFYDEAAVAAFFGTSISTEQKKRVSGTGAAFHKFSRLVRYQGKDILAYAKTCRRLSTSDRGEAAE